MRIYCLLFGLFFANVALAYRSVDTTVHIQDVLKNRIGANDKLSAKAYQLQFATRRVSGCKVIKDVFKDGHSALSIEFTNNSLLFKHQLFEDEERELYFLLKYLLTDDPNIKCIDFGAMRGFADVSYGWAQLFQSKYPKLDIETPLAYDKAREIIQNSNFVKQFSRFLMNFNLKLKEISLEHLMLIEASYFDIRLKPTASGRLMDGNCMFVVERIQ